MPLRKAGIQAESTPVAIQSGAELKPMIEAIAPTKRDTPAARAHDKESYWANKEARDIETGIRIRRSGVFQAALQSPALMQYAPTLEAYIELVVRTANAGLAYVNE